MTTNRTMKDIKHIILDKIKRGKNVYGANGIEIIRILQQEKPKICTSCEIEKKEKDFIVVEQFANPVLVYSIVVEPLRVIQIKLLYQIM